MAVTLKGTHYQHDHGLELYAACEMFAKMQTHRFMGTWKGIDKDSFFALWFAAVHPDLPAGRYQVYAQYRTHQIPNYDRTCTISTTKMVGIKLTRWDDIMPGHAGMIKLGEMTV